MVRSLPYVIHVGMLVSPRGWTTLCLEENAIRRLGANTASSCTGSAQFCQNLVRDFRKCASERSRKFRAVDATESTKEPASNVSYKSNRCPWLGLLLAEESREIRQFIVVSCSPRVFRTVVKALDEDCSRHSAVTNAEPLGRTCFADSFGQPTANRTTAKRQSSIILANDRHFL